MEKYGFTNNRQEINKKEDGEIHKNWRNKLENLAQIIDLSFKMTPKKQEKERKTSCFVRLRVLS